MSVFFTDEFYKLKEILLVFRPRIITLLFEYPGDWYSYASRPDGNFGFRQHAEFGEVIDMNERFDNYPCSSFIIDQSFLRMKSMQKLAVALLVVALSGCAVANKKSDGDIFQAAIDAVERDSGIVNIKVLGFNIPSSGLVSDQMVIVAGGGRLLTGLKGALTQLKSTPNAFLVIKGENPSLDYAIISNAVKGIELSGSYIVYSGLDSKQAQIAEVIQSSGANYYFVDKKK